MYEFKLDTGSDGNLILMKMYKSFFLCRNNSNINKSIHRKIVLYAYNCSCIPQMDINCIKIVNKGHKYQWNFL